MASVEHLKPAAKNGADEMFNYDPACVYYNSDRGDKDFLLQLQEHPETYINSQKCID